MKHYSTLVLVVLAAPAIAHADAATDLSKDLDVHFSYWETYRDDPGSRAESLKTDPTPDACDAAIAKGRKGGLRDDAKIFSRRITSKWDDAHYDAEQNAYVTLAEADQICKRWRKMVLVAPAAFAQTNVAKMMSTYQSIVDSDPESLGATMGQQFTATAKECLEITDKALKAGAPADAKVMIASEEMSITEGRAKICVAATTWAAKTGERVAEARKAAFEAAAAPWRALGVSGAKLDLFVEYDDVGWRGGKNCQLVDDKKQLAKAKVLFQWLGETYGRQEIRKYTFNGNKVSGPVIKYYDTAGQAQRGCK